MVDAAIYKLIRMVRRCDGGLFRTPAAERGLGEFLRTVPGRTGGSMGINAFLEGYLDCSADLRAGHRGDRARSRTAGRSRPLLCGRVERH